ncbi:fascin domain-containing protein [Amycolatopsis sp. NPDC004747]
MGKPTKFALATVVLTLTTAVTGVSAASAVPFAAPWHTDPGRPNCRTVYLRSNASYYWVAAELGGGDRRLRARSSNRDLWEAFLLRGQGYDYTLYNLVERKYVSADIGGDGTLYARAAVRDTWEQFRIFTYHDVDSQTADVNITSAVNGRYVSADIGGDGTLRARATVPDLWEGFQIRLLEEKPYDC